MKKMVIMGLICSLIACNSYAAVSSEKNSNALLVFGNSLSDTGAGYALSSEQGAPVPPVPPYFNKRYSNGPNWVDYVSGKLKLPVQNFAVGGAQTGSGNSITGYTDLGGLFQQIARYSAANRRIPDGTLTIVEIGSNDFLSLLQNPSLLTPEGIANEISIALSDVATAITELQDLGASQIILWNVPNLGDIPVFTNGPPLDALAGVFSQISESYNTLLADQIRVFNTSKHKQVFIFNAEKAQERVLAELAARGINTSEHTFTTLFQNPPIAIQTGPLDPNLAYFDQEHPTTLAWSLFSNEFAGFIDTVVDGPRFIAAERDLVFEGARAHRNVLENRYRMINERYYVCPPCCNTSCEDTCEKPQGQASSFQFYVDGLAKWGNVRTRQGTFGQSFDTELATVGAEMWYTENLTVGTSFTYQKCLSHVNHGRGKINFTDYIPTVYAALTTENYFVDFDVSYHIYDFWRIRRRIPFINAVARSHPTGWGLEPNLRAGYLHNNGCITTGPTIGIGAHAVHIHHYRERGARTYELDFKVSKQIDHSLLGAVGWQFFWNRCDSLLQPYAEITYEHEFLRNERRFKARMFELQAFAKNYHKTSRPDRDWLKLDVGVNLKINDCFGGNISYIGEANFHNHWNNAVRAEVNAWF